MDSKDEDVIAWIVKKFKECIRLPGFGYEDDSEGEEDVQRHSKNVKSGQIDSKRNQH